MSVVRGFTYRQRYALLRYHYPHWGRIVAGLQALKCRKHQPDYAHMSSDRRWDNIPPEDMQ